MTRKIKCGFAVLASPFIIILLAALALYIPLVQNWAVRMASRSASEATGMNISVEKVRLAFPLDLSIEGVKVLRQNDSLPQKTDTIAIVNRAIVDVQLLPLLKSEVCADAMEIIGVNLNTQDFIPQAQIRGNVERLALVGGLPVAKVAVSDYAVMLKKIQLDNAYLDIALNDTVPEDTTTSENLWKINVEELTVRNSDILLHTPGDSMQIGLGISALTAKKGKFDLYNGLYELATCNVSGSNIRYDNMFAERMPQEVLDANHIFLNDVNATIDSLRFLAPDLKVKVKSMSMQEKSGLRLTSLSADIAMDSTNIKVNGMLKTPSSYVATRVSMDMDAFSTSHENKGKVTASIDASISKQDIVVLASGTTDMKKIWPECNLNVKGNMEGNMQSVLIPSLSVEMPTIFTINASGSAKGFMSLSDNPYSKDFTASLHADLQTRNLAPLSKVSSPMVADIAPLTSQIDVNVQGADYDIIASARNGKGTLFAKAGANLASMLYNIDVKAKDINVGNFIKGQQLGLFTGSASVSGQGTDILSKKTWFKAKADIDRFDFAQYKLNAISSDITLKDGKANVNLDAHNSLIDGNVSLDALLNKNKLNATLMAELGYIDLYNLRMVDKPLKISVCSHIDLTSNFRDIHYVQGDFGDLYITDSVKTYHPEDITLDIRTDRDTTIAGIFCGDFLLKLNAQGGYKMLGSNSDKLAQVIKQQITNRTIDQMELRNALPRMSLTLHSSKENPIYRLITYYDVEYDEINARIRTSIEDGINGGILIKGLSTQGYQLDTIKLKLSSSNAPYSISYQGQICNVKPNDYIFRVLFDGEVLEHGISANTRFYDEDNVLGLKLGMEANMTEEGIKFHLTPEHPVIAYSDFTLSKDNYILLDNNNRMFADVSLFADDGTEIQLYSTNTEDTADDLQNITFSFANLNIGKLLSTIPYAPKVEGKINGDLHFIQEEDLSFSISSSINTQNLIYENCLIGNLATELVYIPKEDGSHNIDGILSLDEKEIGTLQGSYNFNTSQILADFDLKKFPLRLVNGFVPDQIIGLDGYAEGTLTIQGTTKVPQVDGELYLESASLISVPYGIKMRFDDDPIRFVDSRLLFENFQIYANNNQPLASYGELNFKDLDHIRLNLLMRAENFLLIDAKETKRSEAYGKAYVNFFAAIKGELDKLQVTGKLDVLPTTDLYYILRDSPLSNDNTMKELVTFTDFQDSTDIEITRPSVDGMRISMNVNVMNGSHIKCWLNNDRTNYLYIIGEGDLLWKSSNSNMSLTGRYTISEGEIKYSLPVIPLKTFVIANGSYIEFNGDMMNPRLNITATETQKASANVGGTNRMVTFNTGVKLSKTLNDMGLEFIIDAPEDNSISDDLNMKSAEERGRLAVTMLTTGMYLSDGNTSSFSMNSALNSFLQSEISNIAGSALKTLDLSFGMDNSTEEDGTMHTNYSFKFAKRFWNNRLAISVGGKISTGPDVSGQNKSFFDNVEVQYRLSDVSNKYMNLFYNRSVYDFLEGYVGQYGGGFMWKKKLQHLKEIFKPAQEAVSARNKFMKRDSTTIIESQKKQ